MNQKDILNLIHSYHETGLIHDGLIPFYDQFGRWRGDTINWRFSESKSALEAIGTSRLPESRITLASDRGPVLQTSFYGQNSTPITLVYSEVKGSVVATKDVMVYAPLLRKVSGHFIIRTNRRIYVPSLEVVAGNFDVMRGSLLHAQRLSTVGGSMMIGDDLPPCLETVGGRLAVYRVHNFEACKLRHVGRSLSVPKAKALNAPVLETVGCSLLVGTAETLHVPVLRSIEGDFIAPSAIGIRARSLESVGGDMDTSSAKGYYHPSIAVAGEWTTYPGAIEAWHAAQRAKKILRATSKTIYL